MDEQTTHASERSWEYATRGDYHKALDPSWRYYPVYVAKMEYVRACIEALAPNARILDTGCGEGVLVEEFRRRGRDIVGVDLNYATQFVRKGNITRLDDPDGSYDAVLSLDVLEHLGFADQEKAVREIARVLRPRGLAIVSVPNLAHFASRFTFLVLGRLIRTSSIDRHPGDRPVAEFMRLFADAGLEQITRKGLFPTYPLLSLVTALRPRSAVALHRVANRLVAIPSFSFLNIFELRKPW